MFIIIYDDHAIDNSAHVIVWSPHQHLHVPAVIVLIIAAHVCDIYGLDYHLGGSTTSGSATTNSGSTPISVPSTSASGHHTSSFYLFFFPQSFFSDKLSVLCAILSFHTKALSFKCVHCSYSSIAKLKIKVNSSIIELKTKVNSSIIKLKAKVKTTSAEVAQQENMFVNGVNTRMKHSSEWEEISERAKSSNILDIINIWRNIPPSQGDQYFTIK